MKEKNMANGTKKEFCPKCSSTWFIALIGVVIGIGATLLAQKFNYQHEESLFERNFRNMAIEDDSDLSIAHDDFDFPSEMAEMEKRIGEVMVNHQKRLDGFIKNLKEKNKSSGETSIATHEDDKNYYYELHFSGFKKDEVNAVLEGNILTFSAVAKKENKKDKNYSSTNFQYVFTVPEYNRDKEPEIKKFNDKIVVTIAK